MRITNIFLLVVLVFCLQGCFLIHKSGSSSNFYLSESGHGIFSENSDEIPLKNTPTGTHRVITDFELLKSCDTIPAKLGLIFGISYSIFDSKSDSVWITSKWHLPDTMMNNQGQKFQLLTRTRKCDVHNSQITNYKFDERFEMIPGDWTLQLLDGKRLLLEKKFIVVLPK